MTADALPPAASNPFTLLERHPATGVIRLTHNLGSVIPWRQEDIEQLAAGLPRRWLDAYDNVDAARALPPAETALAGIARLQSVPGVVRLEHLELVPGLRMPIREAVASAAAALTPGEDGSLPTSVLYVGSRASSAAVHVDHHHNVFAHLSGHKRFGVAWYIDRRQAQRVAEASFGGPPQRGEPDGTEVFELEPGDGLYVPPYTLHWVESGEDRTVSVACSWATAATRDAARLHSVNARLRRLGIQPGWPGDHPRWDKTALAVGDPLLRRAWSLKQAVRRRLP